MARYRIKTHDLCWYWSTYEVEAESEEQAQELIHMGEGFVDSDFDCVDQIDIDQIEEIDD